jgi:2-methylaconitate cis-trans-isomerase PrpF
MRGDSLQALEKCTITDRLVAAPADAGIRIAQPSGTMTGEAGIRKSGEAVTGVDCTAVFRTARPLFAGGVLFPIHPPH